MNITPNAFVATETRTVTVRMRPDLRVHRACFQGRTSWVVKDPLSQRYFQLTDEEYTVLRMLNGPVGLSDIKAELERRYPPRKTTHQELQSLLHLFHQRGLVLADAPGQGEQLIQRRRDMARRMLISRLTSPLFLRVPGVDPERFLSWVHPKVRWIYSRWCLIACGLLVLSALLLIIIQADSVYARLPSLPEMFAAENVVWLMFAMSAVKILHELGHAVTCKHFGGECHEIGLAFLVFMPCLYCDTTDSWILPNKWHRASIGAAGMYVEIMLASACTFIWWYSQPGLLHYLCLNLILVCSVSTVIFNGNPLLRYDGYYILSDLLEIPNLWQRSRATLVGLLRQWCLGLSWPSEIIVPDRQRFLFALYAVASVLYRWVVLFAILSFFAHALEPYGMQVLGHMVIGICLGGLVLTPIWRTIQYFSVAGRIRQVKRNRALATACLLMLLSCLVFLVPLPNRVMTTAIIQPADAERIYVEVPGTLERADVQPGEAIAQGERVAQLENADVELDVAKLLGQRDRLELHLMNLVRRQGQDPDAAAQIPQTEAALVDLQDRLRSRRKDQQRLSLDSPVAGVVIPPVAMPARPEVGELSGWSGLPFDAKNLGCFLETGTLFCLIGQPDTMEAVLVVDQTDIEFVRRAGGANQAG